MTSPTVCGRVWVKDRQIVTDGGERAIDGQRITGRGTASFGDRELARTDLLLHRPLNE